MSRETYAERRHREAARDQLREWGMECAERTAYACMVGFERTGENWPRVRFDRQIGLTVPVCECGMTMTPLPVPNKTYGYIKTWFCPFCGLDDLIRHALLVSEAANSHE